MCIRDRYKAEELVSALKASTKLPIDLHTHYTSGVASMTYLKAVESGCDIIDTAMSPFALGKMCIRERYNRCWIDEKPLYISPLTK